MIFFSFCEKVNDTTTNILLSYIYIFKAQLDIIYQGVCICFTIGLHSGRRDYMYYRVSVSLSTIENNMESKKRVQTRRQKTNK